MFRKLLILLVVTCLLFVCVGCGGNEQEMETGYRLYYINSEETGLESRGYTLRGVTLEAQLKEVMVALGTTPEKLEYKAPLAMGFSVLGFHLESGRLTINFDGRYSNLEPTTEVLIRAAVVKSFTGIEDVNFVFITVGGEPLKDSLGKYVGGMNAVQFIDNDEGGTNTFEEVKLTLYFTNRTGDGLVAAGRTKEYNTNVPLEKLVLEELIKGPNAEGVYPTINSDTKVESVIVRDGICYVNFNENFLLQKNEVTPEVAIYSVVNSLIELNNVDMVQISVNGDNSILYREKLSLTDYYEANMNLLMQGDN